MKVIFYFPLILAAVLFLAGTPATSWGAKEFQSGEFSFVKDEVDHLADGKKSPAKEKDLLKENSLVDTGGKALTQLAFADTSVLRLGPNTQFSFQSKERIIKLEKGAMTMNVPPGNGGVTVDGGGVTGAVSGTTIMASKDSEGNFAFAVLETQGTAKIVSGSGQTANLVSGQIALVRRSDGSIKICELNLDAVIHSSLFFTAFPAPMPGLEKVMAVADGQASEVKNEIKSLLSYSEVGLAPEDPEKATLGLLFGKTANEMVATKNSFVGELATAAGKDENSDASGQNATVLGADAGTKGGSISDARQPEGEEIASKSNPPSDTAGGLGETDTAAGEGDVADTDTAAGGGGAPDTQAPAPVGGGTTINPSPATPTGSNG